MSDKVLPRYKLLLCYDIIDETSDAYFQFVTREFVPSVQALGLHFWRVFHTAYGPYPIRQVEFFAADLDTLRRALASDAFRRLEGTLQQYIANYSKKIVQFREEFQF